MSLRQKDTPRTRVCVVSINLPSWDRNKMKRRTSKAQQLASPSEQPEQLIAQLQAKLLEATELLGTLQSIVAGRDAPPGEEQRAGEQEGAMLRSNVCCTCAFRLQYMLNLCRDSFGLIRSA